MTNADGGLGPQPKSEPLSAGGTKRFHVRAVRGAPPRSGSGPIHDFVDNGDGTVTDRDTGLMWQQGEEPTPMSWEAALTRAERLTLAGHDDWRLPNLKELRSLGDETLVSPAIDRVFFPGVAARGSRTWASTTEINRTSRAWCVDFELGIVTYADKATPLGVRAVTWPMSCGRSPAGGSRALSPGSSFIAGSSSTRQASQRGSGEPQSPWGSSRTWR